MAEAASHPLVSPLGAPLEEGLARFGTDGIRGRVGTSVTPALALQVGYWTGVVLQADGPVVIGTDSRRSGPMLVAALAAPIGRWVRADTWNEVQLERWLESHGTKTVEKIKDD